MVNNTNNGTTNNDKYFSLNDKIMNLFMNEAFYSLGCVNLSANEYRTVYNNDNIPENVFKTYDEFILNSSKCITDENQSKEYLKVFNREHLLNIFKRGSGQQLLKYKVLLNDGSLYWFETKIVFLEESNNEIFAVYISKNINAEMSQINHMGLLMKKERIYKTAINANASGYFEVNLTKDIIIGKILDYRFSKSSPTEIMPDLGYPVCYSKFMKWSLDNIFKSNIQSFILNTDKEYLISKFHSGARTHEVRFWTYDRKGQIHYHKQTYFMSKDELTGDIIAVCILKDDSESQRKEDELKRNNEIISVLSDEYTTIFYVDVENNIVIPYRITPEFKNLFRIHNLDNKNYSEIMECYINNIVVEDDRENVRKSVSVDNIRHKLYHRKNFCFIYRSKSIGISRFFEMKIAKIGQGSSFQTFVVGFSNKDDHFRKEKERQSRITQNNEIINVLASEYEFVFYVDLDTDTFTPYNLSGVNGQIIAKYMRSAKKYSEIKKIYVDNWIVDEDKERMFNESDIPNIRKQLLNKKTYTAEFLGYNKNHDIHYYEMKVIRVDDKSVPSFAVVGVADKNDEIRRQNEYNEQLEVARKKAEDANKAKSTFLFNMSHDIRTPMNAILGFTSMAKKYIDDFDKISECLDKVEISGNHLLSLINDVLDMARIESNKIIIEETPNNIRSDIQQIIQIMQQNASEKDIELSLDIKNLTDEDIYVDALRLNRIIMNIMSNSLKYTKPGGSIMVTVEQFPSDKPGYGKYDLVFSDTGIGMSKEFLETIFDSFTREKTSTISGIQGTGLGMAITKSFVELMGGTIDIDSALGIGTTVTCHMYFRIQVKPTEDDDIDFNNNDIDFSKVRVLLVEDNELNLEIAKDILEELGVTVEDANDGSVAVDMVNIKPAGYYDLIFMDIQMPYMDGYKATRAIRSIKDNNVSNVPIVAMTANAFEEDKKKAFESGMNGHLAKPLNIHELINTLCKFCIK